MVIFFIFHFTLQQAKNIKKSISHDTVNEINNNKTVVSLSENVKKRQIIQNKSIISIGIIRGKNGAIHDSWGLENHGMFKYYTKTENIKTNVNYNCHRLCSKLNNTEAKLSRVPPHCFVIVVVMPWIWHIVVVLSILIKIIDNNGPSLSHCQIIFQFVV